MTRRCGSCGRDKPLDQYRAKQENRSGLDGVCIACREGQARNRAYYGGVIQAMCSGKKAYPDNATAAVVASRVLRNAPMLRPYRCPVCALWHLTHKEMRSA